tara:strand:- start:675 stop:1019 length:345 start_codon:yes stop_codon:yes gene_type:complete
MKYLGKIERVKFGLCGYQNQMLGIRLTLRFKESLGSVQERCFWDYNKVENDNNCKWDEESRSEQAIEVMRYISDLLAKAKVEDINDLVGIPIEVECEGVGMEVKSFRVLEEVLI